MTDPPVRLFPGRDGMELAYREIGDGRPLVLFHGFAADGLQWLRPGPAAVFARHGYRVILLDLRGHGASARPHEPSAYPPDVLTDDGLALIDRLGLHDYDLGGYSLGGRIALRMLVRGARPGRAIVGGQGLEAVTRTPGTEDGRHRVLAALANGDPIEPGSPDAEQAYWITRLGGDPRALLLARDTLIATSEAELRRIETPTLVLAGDRDGRHASAEALAATLTGGRFTRVPGDHFTALGSAELATAILAFLGSRGPAPSPRPSRA